MWLTIKQIQKQLEKEKASKVKYWCLNMFDDRKKLKKKIDSYFYHLETRNEKELKEVPSMSWLAVWLWTSAMWLSKYRKENEFREIIMSAKQRIQEQIVNYAMLGKIKEWFAKFYLKNLDDWKEQTENISTVKKEKTVLLQIVQPKIEWNVNDNFNNRVVVEWEEVESSFDKALW